MLRSLNSARTLREETPQPHPRSLWASPAAPRRLRLQSLLFLGLLLGCTGLAQEPALKEPSAAPAHPLTPAVPASPDGLTAPAAAAADAAAGAYDYPVTDPLFATVTAMTSLPKAEKRHPAEKTFTLKKIEGFKRSLKVRALLQDQNAPLAVILLGFSAHSRAPLAGFWEGVLFKAGCHVLVFDSVFRGAFNEAAQQGVPGWMPVEARQVAAVIKAFLTQEQVQGKVSRIGLVGASYGGLVALNLMRHLEGGKAGLEVARALIFSPPLNARTSARILDDFAEQDRPRYSLMELARLRKATPGDLRNGVPFPASLMRAGIGYIFREDLEEALETCDSLYNCRLPPEPVGMHRQEYQVGRRVFTRYIEQIVFPYWEERGEVKSLQHLAQAGDLAVLMRGTQATVRLVLTADDPLNDSAEFKTLLSALPAGQLTVLPHGGHLGYIGCEWAKTRVARLFAEN